MFDGTEFEDAPAAPTEPARPIKRQRTPAMPGLEGSHKMCADSLGLVSSALRPELRSSGALVTVVFVARVRRCIIKNVMDMKFCGVERYADRLDDGPIFVANGGRDETIEESIEAVKTFFTNHLTILTDIAARDTETWLGLVVRIVNESKELVVEKPVYSSVHDGVECQKMQMVPYLEREKRHHRMGVHLRMDGKGDTSNILVGEIYKNIAGVRELIIALYTARRFKQTMWTAAFTIMRQEYETEKRRMLTPGTSNNLFDSSKQSALTPGADAARSPPITEESPSKTT